MDVDVVVEVLVVEVEPVSVELSPQEAVRSAIASKASDLLIPPSSRDQSH